MKNPHIIVAHPGICLCGTYEGEPLGCAQIIEELESQRDKGQATRSTFALLSCVKECGS